MRVAVVGAGIMGVATAYELTRRAHEVTVFEQFELGHARGSSHGRSRIVRLAYPEAEWVRLAAEAMRRWREIEADMGETLLELTGLVELEPFSTAALEACGVPWEELDPAELARRFGVRAPAGSRPTLQPEAGYVRADRAHAALLAGARSRGASVHERARIDQLDDVDAEVVVVTAGAWAKPLLATSGIDLDVVPTRETVAYFRLASERPIPSVVALAQGGHGLYSLADPVHGLKVGHHQSGRPTDPDDEGVPDPDILRGIVEWANAIFELADPEPVAAETCLYTNTADERFVLERHGRIVVGSACSGHGFKFAPAVGARLADLATGA
jgi:monomeric sarcosine oxidase